MKITIYQKPPLPQYIDPMPKGAHITVSATRTRVYFNADLVEHLKLLSFPPSFAFNDQNHWFLLLAENQDHSFPIHEYQGSFYIHSSDMVHRLLQLHNQPSKVYFIVKPTQNPHLFAMQVFQPEENPESYRKKKYSKNRKYLAQVPKEAPKNYYDTLLYKLLKGS